MCKILQLLCKMLSSDRDSFDVYPGILVKFVFSLNLGKEGGVRRPSRHRSRQWISRCCCSCLGWLVSEHVVSMVSPWNMHCSGLFYSLIGVPTYAGTHACWVICCSLCVWCCDRTMMHSGFDIRRWYHCCLVSGSGVRVHFGSFRKELYCLGSHLW